MGEGTGTRLGFLESSEASKPTGPSGRPCRPALPAEFSSPALWPAFYCFRPRSASVPVWPPRQARSDGWGAGEPVPDTPFFGQPMHPPAAVFPGLVPHRLTLSAGCRPSTGLWVALEPAAARTGLHPSQDVAEHPVSALAGCRCGERLRPGPPPVFSLFLRVASTGSPFIPRDCQAPRSHGGGRNFLFVFAALLFKRIFREDHSETSLWFLADWNGPGLCPKA